MRILGLHGRAGAGKDTFADRLVEKHGWIKLGFSDALYEEVSAAFGVEVHELFDRKRKEKPDARLALGRCYTAPFIARFAASGYDLDAPRAPREVLQLWGTEFRREYDTNYWVNQLAKTVASLDPYPGVAIRDTRFENEAKWIRSVGGKVYEITRPSGAETPHQHVSERRLPQELIDATVANNSSLDWINFCADFCAYISEEAWASR